MKNKLLALTLSLLLLSGCSLADPDLGEATLPQGETADAMVGVVVTREHLDLFDMEAFVQDNAASLLSGKDTELSQGYYQKLYANRDAEGRAEFDLPGSMSCFYYEYESPHGSTVAIVNDGVYGASPHLKQTDEGQSLEMSGVIYVPTGPGDVQFFFNPVYQEPDGDVYLLPGSGSALNGDNGEGMSFSHKMSNSITRTLEGKTETRSCAIDITVELKTPPRSVRLLQMNGDGALLHSVTWAPGEVPGELALHPDCVWAVLEQDKGETCDRALYNLGAKSMESFYAEDSLVKIRTTTLVWP